MKLSEAILQGDVMKRQNAGLYLGKDFDGQYCGCALGGALLANGLDLEVLGEVGFTQTPVVKAIHSLWPFLTEQHIVEISSMYMDKAFGKRTIQDIVKYAESIEPGVGDPVVEEFVPEFAVV